MSRATSALEAHMSIGVYQTRSPRCNLGRGRFATFVATRAPSTVAARAILVQTSLQVGSNDVGPGLGGERIVRRADRFCPLWAMRSCKGPSGGFGPALLLLIGLSLAAALDAQDPAAERLLREAQRLHQAGDAAAAASQLQLLVSRFPEDRLAAPALLRQAELERERGNATEAGKAVETLLARHAQSPEAAHGLNLQAAMVLGSARSSQELAEAQNLYRRVVLLFGRETYPMLAARSEARIGSARLALALGDPATAAAELVAAIEDEPAGTFIGHAKLVLGRAWIAAGELPAAVQVLGEVAGDNDGYAEQARRLLSLIHRRPLRQQAGEPPWLEHRRLTLTGVELRELSGIAAAADGRLLVVDQRLSLFALVDATGGELARQTLEDIERPGWRHGLSLEPFVASRSGVVLPLEPTRLTFTDPKRSAPVKNVLAIASGAFGDWFVAAKGARSVIYVPPSGGESRQLLASSRPDVVDLANDRLGNVYALDAKASQVTRISRDALVEGVVVSGNWKKATALDVDELGNLYVLDRGERRIELYASDGRRVASVGPDLGSGIELRNPVDVTVDGSGRLFIADTRLPFVVVLD